LAARPVDRYRLGMAQLDIVQRLLDAGADFSEMTQRNADRLVKSLVETGDLQAGQAQKAVSDLMEQGRKSRERLRKLIDREVQAQVSRMGLATKADVRRLERKIETTKKAATKSKSKSAKSKDAKAKSTKKTPAKKK
jgi:polyhydroxyalkanoate synthesis regulator phasin